MNDPTKKKTTYQLLALVFAVAGLVWIIGGVISFRFFLYPFIGLLNWAVAWYCWQTSQTV